METNPRILLTGPPKIGKTTVIERLVELLRAADVTIGGFITREIRKDGIRIAFAVSDLETGAEATIAHVNSVSEIRVGKFGVNVAEFEAVGIPALKRALADRAAVLIVDEIANMELASKLFTRVIMEAIVSDHPLVATIHAREHPVTDQLRSLPQVDVIEVTETNRDALPAELAARLKP